MNASTLEVPGLTAETVTVTDESLVVGLSDGRVVSVPLAWYPRLLNGSRSERSRWRLIGRGMGIHWPELDEDLSVEGLLRGAKSGESQASFAKWMAARHTARLAKKGGRRHALPQGYAAPKTSKNVRRVAEPAERYGK